MYSIIKLCFLALVQFNIVHSRECSDCINYNLCPKALNLALYSKTDKTKQLFNDAYCGHDKSGDMQLPKVCCSAFSNIENEGQIQDTSEDRIANHKNLKLLPEECGIIKGDRVVGGSIAELNEFPWMALISHQDRYGINFKCGGTIINKRYILTAAHCVVNKTIPGIRVGEYNLDSEIDCVTNVCINYQDYQIEKAITHEHYNSMESNGNDIALLRVAADIDFNQPNIQRICLPTTAKLRHQDLTNEIGTVTGWGFTEQRVTSSILRKVDIPIFSSEECSDLYIRFSGHPPINQFCAGSANKDSCGGDSGGPFMLLRQYNNINRYIQYGVVSHGPKKCGSDVPGAYTDLRKFMGWILDNISP